MRQVAIAPRKCIQAIGLAPIALLVLVVLVWCSLWLGAADISLSSLLSPSTAAASWELLLISRVPRTLALILAGAAMATAGLIMQMLVQNRFVEPSTAGTVESATLGILAVTIVAPGIPVFAKMMVAALFALAGTGLFLLILKRVPLRSSLLVPVIGLVLGGVIAAITTFVAYQYDLIQSIQVWSTGDFSGVIKGRYELLWLGLAITCIAYIVADKFTVIGMGSQFTTNLGINYKRLLAVGLCIVAVISAVVVVTAGNIPFLGLLIPNIVSLFFGDNLRKSLPWVAYLGASFVLLCDIIGRTVFYPHEVPIGTVVGVIGSFFFLYLLLNKRVRFN